MLTILSLVSHDLGWNFSNNWNIVLSKLIEEKVDFKLISNLSYSVLKSTSETYVNFRKISLSPVSSCLCDTTQNVGHI